MLASIQLGSTKVEDFTCIIKRVESVDRIVKLLKESIMPLKIFHLILFTSKLCFPNVLASLFSQVQPKLRILHALVSVQNSRWNSKIA